MADYTCTVEGLAVEMTFYTSSIDGNDMIAVESIGDIYRNRKPFTSCIGNVRWLERRMNETEVQHVERAKRLIAEHLTEENALPAPGKATSERYIRALRST